MHSSFFIMINIGFLFLFFGKPAFLVYNKGNSGNNTQYILKQNNKIYDERYELPGVRCDTGAICCN